MSTRLDQLFDQYLTYVGSNLKVLLSVGGWTYSQAGHFGFVTDATKRTTFINSAVSMIENYGFDGMLVERFLGAIVTEANLI
jgi:GH18 family chitinase